MAEPGKLTGQPIGSGQAVSVGREDLILGAVVDVFA